MIVRLLAVLLLVSPATAQSPDLALVPGDAIGFMHVRVADIWKHDMFKGVRETVAAAGPQALVAFEKQMYPSLKSLDQFTVMLTMAPNRQEPDILIVASFTDALEVEKIHKLYLPMAKEREVGGKKLFVDAEKNTALTFPEGKLLVVGPVHSVEAFAQRQTGNQAGPLAAAMAAAKTKAFTLAVNVKALPIPPKEFDEIPPDVRPLAMVEKALLTMDLSSAEPVFELRAGYANEAAAIDAERGLKAAIGMAKQAMTEPRRELEKALYENADKGPQPIEISGKAGMALVALGGMNQMEKMLDTLPIARTGSELTAKGTMPKEMSALAAFYSSVGIGLMLPAVQKVRDAAEVTSSSNNLKQMGLAYHNYLSVYQTFPPAAICDKEGKPLLSWRVALLPYLEQDALYRQFKLDEPWDSPNNKPLIEKMPMIYADPRLELKPGMTTYKAFVGKDAILDWKASRKLNQVTDGFSNTMIVASAGDPVIWTKPDDFTFDPSKDLPKLELPPGGGKAIIALFGDGSVRTLNLERLSAETLKALIGAADGQWVNPDGDEAPKAQAIPARPAEEAKPPRPASQSKPPR